MHYSTLAAALVLCTANAYARDPAAEVLREAQQLAECTKALDTQCVLGLSDVASYRLLNGPQFDLVKSETRMFDGFRDRGYLWTQFEVSAPSKVFKDASRLYAFVPYASTLATDKYTSVTQAYLLALSADSGETWKFVDGRGLTPSQVKAIVPSYAGELLPKSHTVERPTSSAQTNGVS